MGKETQADWGRNWGQTLLKFSRQSSITKEQAQGQSIDEQWLETLVKVRGKLGSDDLQTAMNRDIIRALNRYVAGSQKPETLANNNA